MVILYFLELDTIVQHEYRTSTNIKERRKKRNWRIEEKYKHISALNRNSSPRSARLARILKVTLVALRFATVPALAEEVIEVAVYVRK